VTETRTPTTETTETTGTGTAHAIDTATITEILPDDELLRHDRRDRVLAAMTAAGVDVLVLGREANARYVSGVPRLWLAGTRPVGASCVLVRESGAIHLLTTWDEGVPDDIPREHLYGYTFNPRNMLEVLRSIDGARGFHTVATDGLSSGAVDLMGRAFPAADIVDGDELMRHVRSVKLPAEVDAIRAAVGIAERSLHDAAAAVVPGTTERKITGTFMETMGGQGICMPSVQDVAWATSPSHPWRRAGRDAPIPAGALVALEGGVMLDGYDGELGRTVVAGGAEHRTPEVDALIRRRDELWHRLVDVCRPGAPLAELLRVYEDADVPAPPRPVAFGLGLGFDAPLVSTELPRSAADEQFEEGMVMALASYVWQEGVGAAFGEEPVVITDGGAELLSSTPFVDGGDG
jgi:Xaa-Pro dipeptidase